MNLTVRAHLDTKSLAMVEKVMIISVSAGTGHTRAAQALEETFHLVAPEVEVLNVDALNYSSKTFRKFIADGYSRVSNRAPHLWGYMYDLTDEETSAFSFYTKVLRRWQGFSGKKLLALVKNEKPDAIISTHFLPPPVLTRYLKKKKLSIPVYCVVTDFDIHNMWLSAGMAGYFAATDLVAHKLSRWDVDPDRIHVTGIPIHPVFNRTWERGKLCEEFQLKPEILTILLMAGGIRTRHVKNLLDQIAREEKPVQVLLATGRNTKLMKKLKNLDIPENLSVKTFGFVDFVEKLMAMSDLIVTKPGGLTVAESMTMKLPMIMIHPIPGQEDRNADYVTDIRAGVKANDPMELEYRLKKILKSPGLLKEMGEAAARNARPDAAAEIIKTILNR